MVTGVKTARTAAYFDPVTKKMVFPAAEKKPEAKKGEGTGRARTDTPILIENSTYDGIVAHLVKLGFNTKVNKYGEAHKSVTGEHAYVNSTVKQYVLGLVAADMAASEKPAKSGK